MSLSTWIVLTTIHVPTVLDTYLDNFEIHEHTQYHIVVVGDLKSPVSTGAYLNSLKKRGVDVHYLAPRKQEEWCARNAPELGAWLPWNSVQRRNLGYLYAAQQGAQLLISIDDDNFVLPHTDYLGEHRKTGETLELLALESSDGWLNLCDYVDTTPKRRFYHRGYPLEHRWVTDAKHTTLRQKKRVAVNVGFWLSDPDIDTFSRMEEPFEVTGTSFPEPSVSLAPGTWHPFNSQNTALHIDLLPCLFLLSIGSLTPTTQILNFRYDDIWMSYFARKAMDHLGDQVAYGGPNVRQDRNPHDMLADLQNEMFPLLLTSKVTQWLRDLKLTATTYAGCYFEIINHLDVQSSRRSETTAEEAHYLQIALRGMRIWLRTVSSLFSLPVE